MTDFKTLLFRAGFMNFGKLDRVRVCDFLCVSERTLERWISDNKPCPRALKLLEMRIDGRISTHPAWLDFKVCRDGYLWTPRGHRYDAAYINKLDFLQRSNRAHEAHTTQLQTEIDNLKDLVQASDRMRDIGKELITMSDRFKFRAVLFNYDTQKDKSA